MSIVNFSVPDRVKRAFDRAFAGENKSAVVARLMCSAIEERQRTRRRLRAMEALLSLRRRARPATAAAIRAARTRGRP